MGVNIVVTLFLVFHPMINYTTQCSFGREPCQGESILHSVVLLKGVEMKGKKNKTSKKQTSILDAAAQIFSHNGYDNTSMDRIAEIAGASKRTVYNHFPSKEDLFKAVLQRFMAEIMELKQIEYNANRSLETQLGEFADAKLGISENPAWLGLMKMTTGVFITNPDLAMETVQRSEDAGDTLVSWLEAARADGRLKVENAALAAKAFWAMVGGAFFWPSIFFGTIPVQEAETLKEELIQIFLARYKT